MRFCILVSAFCLLTSVGFAGLSGLYTIKPDGGGDFISLWDAGVALMDSGITGDCVFEIYGDTLSGFFGAEHVAGSDSWTTTFRPGSGADPVIEGGDQFCGEEYDNVKLKGLRFRYAPVYVARCSGWRISGCRFATRDWGVKLESSSYDTVDANTFETHPAAEGPPVTAEYGSDNVIANNVVNCTSTGLETFIYLYAESNTKVVFNTLRYAPDEMEDGACLKLLDVGAYEARNNVFVLAAPADTLNACVGVDISDSIVLDYNCYFRELLGWAGERPCYPNYYDWDEWRGFGYEANGISADPKLVSATDLHLRQGSPCIGAGVPIPGFEFDIDGDPRDPVHPCIGADEFTGGSIEEMPSAECRMSNTATVIKTLPAGAVAFDAMGRRVLNPKPGVYFVSEYSVVGSQHSGTLNGARNTVHVRKVILQR